MTQDDSILDTIMQMLGPEGDYEHFGADIIVHINAAFERLHDLGVGPPVPFFIESKAETWSEFNAGIPIWRVIRYIFLYTKMVFDPPSNGSVLKTYEQELTKLEWALNVVAETEVE